MYATRLIYTTIQRMGVERKLSPLQNLYPFLWYYISYLYYCITIFK